MKDDRHVIEAYVQLVERQLVASAAEKDSIRAEMLDHLGDAAEAGELEEALQRLGPPEATAATFARARRFAPGTFGRRIAAAAIDNLPLIGITVAMLAADLAHGGGGFAAFPPWVAVHIGGVCLGVPVSAGCGAYQDAGLLYTIGVPLALLWSIVGLGLIESRTGGTPGKRLLGLVVVSEAGLRIRPGAGVLRRTSLLLGPLAWLDWIPYVAGHPRRAFDYVARTRVLRRREP